MQKIALLSIIAVSSGSPVATHAGRMSFMEWIVTKKKRKL
jgi:hypothetical protein